MAKRNWRPRPVTLFCNTCRKPYDLVALTENQRGAIYCPHCRTRLGKVS